MIQPLLQARIPSTAELQPFGLFKSPFGCRSAPFPAPGEKTMRKIIALALWGCADVLEIVRGGLLAAAVKLIGREA